MLKFKFILFSFLETFKVAYAQVTGWFEVLEKPVTLGMAWWEKKVISCAFAKQVTKNMRESGEFYLCRRRIY